MTESSFFINGLTIYEAYKEPGSPICIVDAGALMPFDEMPLVRSLALYVNDNGYLVGVRVTRHSQKGEVVEAEIGDVLPFVSFEDRDDYEEVE